MSTKWIPNFIKRTMQYKPNDILTAQEYNAILNLLITQGDYNSSWLEYLQNDAIPEAIEDLSAEAIAEAISAAVQNEIAALTAAVTNKTCLFLNNPAVTILNVGQQNSGIASLKTLLEDKSLYATYAIAINMIGYSSAYPSLAQLNTLKNAGNDIVAYGTDGTALTVANAETVADICKRYMDVNGFNSNVFVYPGGNSDVDVTEIVNQFYKFGVNADESGEIIPVYYPYTADANTLHSIPLLEWYNTVDLEDVKAYIDSIVENNTYLILQVDTDSANWDASDFEDVLDYIKTKSSMEYPANVQTEFAKIFGTIGNRLTILEGVYVTEDDGVKYLNW